ncbi:unnamed protein product [Urochloa humidicola]
MASPLSHVSVESSEEETDGEEQQEGAQQGQQLVTSQEKGTHRAEASAKKQNKKRARSVADSEVASMARDILAIPVSSVASESAFSSSRKVITHTRSSLSPKTIEALMCLQDWYREKIDQASAASTQEAADTTIDVEESDDE